MRLCSILIFNERCVCELTHSSSMNTFSNLSLDHASTNFEVVHLSTTLVVSRRHITSDSVDDATESRSASTRTLQHVPTSSTRTLAALKHTACLIKCVNSPTCEHDRTPLCNSLMEGPTFSHQRAGMSSFFFFFSSSFFHYFFCISSLLFFLLFLSFFLFFSVRFSLIYIFHCLSLFSHLFLSFFSLFLSFSLFFCSFLSFHAFLSSSLFSLFSLFALFALFFSLFLSLLSFLSW